MIKKLNCLCENNIVDNKRMKLIVNNFCLCKEFSCDKCKLKIIQNPNSNELDIYFNECLIKEASFNEEEGIKDNILYLKKELIIKILYQDNIKLLLDKFEKYSIFQ